MSEERNEESGTTLTLAVNEDCWRVEISNVTRIASDWFLEVIAIGPRTHTFFVRSDRLPHGSAAWQLLLARIGQWLGQHDERRCVFLDLSGAM